ncbi:MAG: EscU/YscU/HrcU family type III secretion system export apparatus switch protein, partial [Alphaproteobacteria bacterium]|nr:EscU/YscU/HrcU family type III secretion system export apparatus switch protein [Alphaproteobacteria bacterium]
MKFEKDHTPSYNPVKLSGQQAVAVAIMADESIPDSLPQIVATGRGKIAQDILEIAFANNINVREDADLAQLLAKLELDTPIPSEAIIIVAEIMAKVYEMN